VSGAPSRELPHEQWSRMEARAKADDAAQRAANAVDCAMAAEVRDAFIAGFAAGRGSYMSDMPTAREALAIWEAGR